MRKLLRKKEIKDLNNLIKPEFLKKSKIELLKENHEEFILIDDVPALFKLESNWLYTLKAIHNKLNFIDYKTVKVDSGAIKFVANGADIMVPGIVEVDENIVENDFVLIIEEIHNKALAIGEALFSGNKIKNMSTGKVIKTIHFVGDSIWNKKIT